MLFNEENISLDINSGNILLNPLVNFINVLSMFVAYYIK